LDVGFALLESVPSCHHFKTTEHAPVDGKGFMAAVYKDVRNSMIVCGSA